MPSPDPPSAVRPLRDPRVRTHLVRDEAILASGTKGKLLALNPTARAVWEQCDGTATLEEIGARLARQYEADETEVLAGVRAIVADFHAKGLLLLREPSPPTPDEGSPVTCFPTFYNHHVEVYIDAPRLARRFERSMGPTFGNGEGLGLGRVEVYEDGEDYRILTDWGSEKTIDRRDASTWLRRRVNWLIIRARPDLLWLHAGAAARGGHAMLCAGAYGSGKSTLVAALYRAGWTYFSDDVLPYDPAAGCVLPYPMTPSYRPGDEELVSDDDLSTLRKTRVFLEPDRIASAPAPVRTLVFPTFRPLDPQPPRERSPASAAVKLAKHCFNVSAFEGDPIRALAELAARTPAFDVEHNPETPARDAVTALCAW